MRGPRLAALALILSVGCATHQRPAAASLVGSYAVEGANDHGSGYGGRVDVIESGGVLHVRWQLTSGEEAFGVALLADGVLSVGFASKGHLGVGTYTRTADGWVGTWSLSGQPGRMPERWRRANMGPILPSHPTAPEPSDDGARERV